MNLVDNKPKISKKSDAFKDERISICTDCRYGIYPKRHKYMWTSRGLVHLSCEERRLDSVEIKTTTEAL